MNKRLLIIPFIVGVLILQIANAKLNEYEQRINNMQHTINTLNNKVEKNENKIDNIQVSRGTPRTFKMVCTAYTHTDEGCNETTYSESKVREGHTVAVNPQQIPIGSIVYVKSENEQVSGYYVAEDVGGLISSGRIDLYMGDKERAYNFGVQSVEVSIIRNGWSG